MIAATVYDTYSRTLIYACDGRQFRQRSNGMQKKCQLQQRQEGTAVVPRVLAVIGIAALCVGVALTKI